MTNQQPKRPGNTDDANTASSFPQGICRLTQDCLMFTRSAAFCAVCAAAIGKVIDEYTLSK